MLPYLVVFTISTLLLYQAECMRKNDNHVFSYRNLIIIVAIVLPCFLAGFRGLSVGRDTGGYPVRYFYSAVQSNSWSEYVEIYEYKEKLLYHDNTVELSFRLLAYIIAKIVPDIRALLFVLQLLTISFVYLGLRKYLKSYIWLGMLAYFCIFYSYSLNVMRQSIACAILFFGSYYIFENDFKKYLAFLSLATFFHYSAIIYIVLFPIGRFVITGANTESVQKIGRTNKRIIIVTFLTAITCIFAVQLLPLLKVLFANSRFYSYLKFSFDVKVTSIIRRMPIICLIILFYKGIIKESKESVIVIAFVFMELFLAQISQLQNGLEIAYRYTLYIFYYYIVAIPQIVIGSGSLNNKKILSLCMICYLLFFWYYSFIYTGGQDVYPYVLNL